MRPILRAANTTSCRESANGEPLGPSCRHTNASNPKPIRLGIDAIKAAAVISGEDQTSMRADSEVGVETETEVDTESESEE